MHKTAESLDTIISLAKSSQGKRLSELTLEQKHAVAFCGYLKNFRLDNENPSKLKVVSKKDTDTFQCGTAIGGAVMWLRKLLATDIMQDCTETNLSPNSFWVAIDEPLPRFEIDSTNNCLLDYPDTLKVTAESLRDFSLGNPPVLPETKTPTSLGDELHRGLNEILFYWYSDQKMPRDISYATFLIQRFLEKDKDFIDILRRVAPYFPKLKDKIDIVDYDFKLTTIKGTYLLSELKETLKDPRASALLWALRGKYVKVRSIE